MSVSVLKTIPVSALAPAGPPGSAYSYTLNGLVGGANYTLWMTSSTWQGDGGVSSLPLTVVLPEDGQSHTHTLTHTHTHTRTHTRIFYTHKINVYKINTLNH